MPRYFNQFSAYLSLSYNPLLLEVDSLADQKSGDFST